MGVYIPNMKMPEHCGVCRFAVDGWCYAYGKPNIDALANDGRTNFCPLIPVPPHGDLMDKKMVWENLAKVLNKKNPPFSYPDWNDAIVAVMTAPTIIPAEEGE